MPNKCVKCGFIFGDNINLLNGCPYCKGKKFFFVNNNINKNTNNKSIKKKEHLSHEKNLSKNSIGSLKILNKGSYEINLNHLFQHVDIIVELIEEGKYIIDLSSLLKKKK